MPPKEQIEEERRRFEELCKGMAERKAKRRELQAAKEREQQATQSST